MRKVKSITLGEETIEQLNKEAEKQNRSFSNLVETAILQFLASL